MTSFRRTGRNERLFLRVGPQGSGTPVVITGRDAALALLREIGGDPWGRAALRRLYAEAMGRTSICAESDQAVLEGLARKLTTGAIRAWSVPVPGIEVSGVKRTERQDLTANAG